MLGCVGHYRVGNSQNNIIYLQTSFDTNEANYIFSEGENTINGSAYIRKEDGRVITASNTSVLLFPVTEYSIDRNQKIFGNKYNGHYNFRKNRIYKRGDSIRSNKFVPIVLEFEPESELYYKYIKETKANYLGQFQFDNIADGEYYIITSIFWEDTKISGGVMFPMPMNLFIIDFNESKYKDGETLMKRVTVKNGEILEVEVTIE